MALIPTKFPIFASHKSHPTMKKKLTLVITALLACGASAHEGAHKSTTELTQERAQERAQASAQESALTGARKLGAQAGAACVYVLHPHEELPAGAGAQAGAGAHAEAGRWRTVFLAGTIDMGKGEDWQKTAEEMFAAGDGNWILYNPRQAHWDPTREGEMDYQVNWELEHLEAADVILMNFLPGSQSPITLLELGLHAKSGKLRVVCPEGFYRYDNVRITCARYGIPLYPTLSDAIAAIQGEKR